MQAPLLLFRRVLTLESWEQTIGSASLNSAEEAVAMVKYSKQMLENHDIDGVMIATCDHQHTKHLVNSSDAVSNRKEPIATVDHGFPHGGVHHGCPVLLVR